jgi:hypothetical protein
MLLRPDDIGIRGFCGLGRSLKMVAPLLAAPAALLLGQGEAKAVLTYNIFESAGNVVVQASGSLDLSGAISSGSNNCPAGVGAIDSFLHWFAPDRVLLQTVTPFQAPLLSLESSRLPLLRAQLE